MFGRHMHGGSIAAIPQVDGTATTLPSASEMLCALAGQYVRGPLCHLARDLVELHYHFRTSVGGREESNCRRVDLVASINQWVMHNLPAPAVGARECEVSLGEFLDRMAAVAACAFDLLMTDDVGGNRMHDAWTRLAVLEVEYGDLVRDVEAGRRHLPSI